MANKFSFSNMFSKNIDEPIEQETTDNGSESNAFNVLKDRVRTMQKRMDEMEKRLSDLETLFKSTTFSSTENTENTECKCSECTELNMEDGSLKIENCPNGESPDLPSSNFHLQSNSVSSVCNLYLSAPSPDGSFPGVSTREQIGKSIYVLTTEDGTNGTFSVIDTNDAIATAMISVSQFLKPVCKVNGSTAQYPHHIVTDEPGTASKEGGVWKVVRKAIVHFS